MGKSYDADKHLATLVKARKKHIAKVHGYTEHKILKQRKLATAKIQALKEDVGAMGFRPHQPTLDRVYRETMAGFKPTFIQPKMVDVLL